MSDTSKDLHFNQYMLFAFISYGLSIKHLVVYDYIKKNIDTNDRFSYLQYDTIYDDLKDFGFSAPNSIKFKYIRDLQKHGFYELSLHPEKLIIFN